MFDKSAFHRFNNGGAEHRSFHQFAFRQADGAFLVLSQEDNGSFELEVDPQFEQELQSSHSDWEPLELA